MSVFRTWLFRVLVIAAAGLFVISWYLHWWNANIYMIDANVWIRPWALQSDLSFIGAESWIKDAEMPAFFAPAMWTYFGLCMLALLVGLFLKDKSIKLGKIKLSLPQMLILLVGISYIAVVVIAIIVMKIEMAKWWGMQLIGTVQLDVGEVFKSPVKCELLLGFWLACCTGPLLVALALLRNKIIGKAE